MSENYDLNEIEMENFDIGSKIADEYYQCQLKLFIDKKVSVSNEKKLDLKEECSKVISPAILACIRIYDLYEREINE